MKTPCYYARTEFDYKYIKNALIEFGYNIKAMPEKYNPYNNLIVLNFENIFGNVASLRKSNCQLHDRYIVKNIGYFINEAAKLKGTTYKKHTNQIMGSQTKNNTMQEPKLGDRVLVKNNGDRNFQARIYFGKYNGKYTCVSELSENNFHKSRDFMVEFWDEMVPKVAISKKDIAEKFNIPLGMFEIV